MNKRNTKKTKEKSFGLPRYLRLAKGSMWFDVEGDNPSGVKLYAMQQELVSRKFEMLVTLNKAGEEVRIPKPTDVPMDDNENSDLINYGKKTNELPWYVDTSKIPQKNLSRVLLAYKYGILVEADPDNPPVPTGDKVTRQFGVNKKGERVFVGKNNEMYKKLQNLNFKNLQDFVRNAPLTSTARENLQDLYEYEIAGHNPLSRPRQEVLDLIKGKLSEYGPGMSAIRINED